MSMPSWVALLRAVNVGGAGSLPMATLRSVCEAAGFAAVKTYIASGNVVFSDDRDEADVRAALSHGLRTETGRELGVLVRSAAEMAGIVAADPFAGRPGNRVVALFTDETVPGDPQAGASGVAGEQLRAGSRAIYIHFPDGQARSRLALPAMRCGTARNMNTVATLARMAAAIRA